MVENARRWTLVQIHNSLKMATQVDRGVKMAFGMLDFIGIEYTNWDVMLQLHKTLVRPHFVYCVQFWLSNQVIVVEIPMDVVWNREMLI